MKSKISFFNKTIFLKNITLYWPIWAIYTMLLLFMQPIALWTQLHGNIQSMEMHKLSNLFAVLHMDPYIGILACTAVIVGMAVFHYLYSSKSANMIHALPVDRHELFFTNVLSGIGFLAVPQFVSALLTMIVAWFYGINRADCVEVWFLLMLGTDIVAFAFVTVCAMVTGHIVALPIYVLIVNFFIYWIYYIIEVVVATFGFGVSTVHDLFRNWLMLLCPYEAFMENIEIGTRYGNDGMTDGTLLVSGIEVLLVYLVIAFVLYIIAYRMYQKRQIEQAGDAITVGWLKPVFRFGVSISGGFFGGLIFREILISTGISCGVIGFMVLILLLGAASYFAAEMIVKKTSHVFQKQIGIRCGICMGLLLAVFGGLYLFTLHLENIVPEKQQVQYAKVNLGYTVTLEGDEIEKIRQIQETILENKELCQKRVNDDRYEYEYVSIEYHLENGRTITRYYRIPYNEAELLPVYDTIRELEDDVYHYMCWQFGDNYEKTPEFYGGSFDVPFKRTPDDGETYEYKSFDINTEQAELLYEAMKADAKAGVLMKYNAYLDWRYNVYADESGFDPSDNYTDAGINLEYKVSENENTLQLDPNSLSDIVSSASRYETVSRGEWGNIYIHFGRDCTNIIDALIRCGYIESAEDICWDIRS